MLSHVDNEQRPEWAEVQRDLRCMAMLVSARLERAKLRENLSSEFLTKRHRSDISAARNT